MIIISLSSNYGTLQLKCKCSTFISFYSSYRGEKVHRHTSCKPWTKKSTLDHYELVSDGTSTRDREWRCKAGYEEDEYSPGQYGCEPITPTVQTTTGKTITTSASSSSTTIGRDHSRNISSPLLDYQIALIVTLVCLGILIGPILFFFRRKLSRCWSFSNTELVSINSPIETVSYTSVPEVTSPLHYNDVFNYFHKMSPVECHIFLRVLPDPSGRFIAPNEYSFQLSDTNGDTKNALIYTCQKWAIKNPGLDYQSIFKKTLSYIKRNDLVEEDYETGSLLDHDLLQEKSSPRQIFNILSHFLTNNLNPHEFEQLLLLLSLNTTDLLVKKQNLMSNNLNIVLSEIDTMGEWWYLKSTQDADTLIQTITDHLVELERNDIIDSQDFQHIITVYRETTITTHVTTENLHANGARCETLVENLP